MIFTVAVGVAVSRPVVPDEKFVFVIVEADTAMEATLIAAQMSCVRENVEMPTSTKIIGRG